MDEIEIMILSDSMDCFFSLCKWLFQSHDVTFFGLPLDPAEGIPSPDSLPVPLPNQNPGSAAAPLGAEAMKLAVSANRKVD